MLCTWEGNSTAGREILLLPEGLFTAVVYLADGRHYSWMFCRVEAFLQLEGFLIAGRGLWTEFLYSWKAY